MSAVARLSLVSCGPRVNSYLTVKYAVSKISVGIRVEGALVNVLRKVSKTKCCYIAEVHCQTIVSRGSRVRGKKNKQEKPSNQNKILKDSNMRSQRAERAGAEVCLFALFDCI